MKLILKYICFFVLCLGAFNAHSNENLENSFRITFSVFTTHLFTNGFENNNNKFEKFNEKNNLIGIESDGVFIGIMNNSFDRKTYLGTYKIMNKTLYKNNIYGNIHSLNLRIDTGISYGYRKNDFKFQPCVRDKICAIGSVGIEYSFNDNYFASANMFANAISVIIQKTIDFN